MANKPTKTNKAEELDSQIRELAARCRLDAWTEFVNEMKVPADVYPALSSGRTELIALIQPRQLSAEEAGVLFKIIGTLIETNSALREHAEQVAHFVDIWSDAFKQLHSVGDRIQRFARFDRRNDDEGQSESPNLQP